MPTIEISLADITDWDSFHQTFAEALQFSDDYGANLDAFFDTMTDWTRPDSEGMIGVEVPYGEDLVLVLHGAAAFQESHGAIWSSLMEILSEINAARLEHPKEGRLLICPA